VPPVYAFLADLGLRITKSLWVFPASETEVAKNPGATCDNRAYLDWTLELQDQGFEIGLHNVSCATSQREQTSRGIERFRELFGHYPYVAANHTGCREGIYWGDYRLTGLHQAFYNLLTRNRNKGVHQGHIEGSDLFWGDICKEKVKYVRNFVFGRVNTLGACPYMPYHDPDRPHVNYWFASSEGPEIGSFNATICERNQDRLAAEGGACTMYTHFAKGFAEDGGLEARFKSLMRRLSDMNGWFVPVGTLLDHLMEAKGAHQLTGRERKRLERRWFLHRFKTGGST